MLRPSSILFAIAGVLATNNTIAEPGACIAYNPLWFVGVLLDAVATLAGTGGKQLLRYAVVKNNVWYYPLGLLCTAVIDPAFDISAYSFAAQSIISPMGGMVVVWNIAIAPFTLGETLTRSRKWGALLIIIGTTLVGLSGNHEDTKRPVDGDGADGQPRGYLQLFARDEALMYYTFLLLFCAVCCYYWRYGRPFVSGFYVGALGGALAGNMFTTKAVVEMLKCLATADPDDPCDQASCAYNPFFTAWPYLFILISLTLACVSLYLLAVGLQKFEALYMITVFEGFMIISGSISGNVVMNEKKGLPWWRVMVYCGAIFIILVGLYILCKGESAGREGSLLTRDMQPASDAEHLAQIEMAEDGAPSSIGRKGRGSSKSGGDSPHEKGALTSSNGNNE